MKAGVISSVPFFFLISSVPFFFPVVDDASTRWWSETLGGNGLLSLATEGITQLAPVRGARVAKEAESLSALTRAPEAVAGAEAAVEGTVAPNTVRGVGSRAVRNTEPLTSAQESEIWRAAQDLGLDPNDIRVLRTSSAYSDSYDVIMIGPDSFPAASGSTSRSVLGRLTPRAVVAHEGGHMITSRAGTAFEGGSLLDEFQASLVGRGLPGLNSTERFQLLRDAVERARAAGADPRDLLGQLKHAGGN